jgi:hypothetical protein
MPVAERIAQLRTDAGASEAAPRTDTELTSFTLQADGSLACELSDGSRLVVATEREAPAAVASAKTAEDVLRYLTERCPGGIVHVGRPMFPRVRIVCGERVLQFNEAGRE